MVVYRSTPRGSVRAVCYHVKSGTVQNTTTDDLPAVGAVVTPTFNRGHEIAFFTDPRHKSLLLQWIHSVLPVAGQSTVCDHYILDAERPCWIPLSRPRFALGELLTLSNDGQMLLQVAENTFTCWDVPLHGPWRWVLGIPAGLLSFLALGSWTWQRWRAWLAATSAAGAIQPRP